MMNPYPELLPAEVIERAKQFGVAQICDGIKAAKLPVVNDGCLAFDMMPVADNMKMVGTAMTIETCDGDNFPMHLVSYSAPAPGYVVVVDGKDYKGRAYCGSLMIGACQAVGYAGAVVDGCVRDKDELAEIGLPVFCRGYSPRGPIKVNEGSINTPIVCAGVNVNPGDLIVGDVDGVVCVPREYIDVVLEQAAVKKAYEDKQTAKIAEYRRCVKAGEEPPVLAPQWVLDMAAQNNS